MAQPIPLVEPVTSAVLPVSPVMGLPGLALSGAFRLFREEGIRGSYENAVA